MNKLKNKILDQGPNAVHLSIPFRMQLNSPRCLISRSCKFSLRYAGELVRRLWSTHPFFLVSINLQISTTSVQKLQFSFVRQVWARLILGYVQLQFRMTLHKHYLLVLDGPFNFCISPLLGSQRFRFVSADPVTTWTFSLIKSSGPAINESANDQDQLHALRQL